MSQEKENINKLKSFFDEEYAALKSYVDSKIRESVNLDADDIIQDVALKLFSVAEGYTVIDNIAGFVYRSVKNKIIDVRRKGTAYKENIEEVQPEQLNDVLNGVEENLYSEDLKKELMEAIRSLPPDYRNIIGAVDFEGYTYREISEETGIPQGTLMSKRHRAIALLRKKIRRKNQGKNT